MRFDKKKCLKGRNRTQTLKVKLASQTPQTTAPGAKANTNAR